jgi:hypothetical protein
MFGIRNETKIMFSLSNWQRLAMNACGCTDCIKLVCAGHAGEKEQTHNQKKRIVILFSLLVNWNTEKWSVPFICMLPTHKYHKTCHLYLTLPLWFKQHYSLNGLICRHKRGDNINTSNIVSFAVKHLGQIYSMSFSHCAQT